MLNQVPSVGDGTACTVYSKLKCSDILTSVTRPDIVATVGILSRKVSAACECNWYLKGTIWMKLCLPAVSNSD